MTTTYQITTELSTNKKEKTPADKLGFGHVFTDHMFVMDYEEGKGWHKLDMRLWRAS